VPRPTSASATSGASPLSGPIAASGLVVIGLIAQDVGAAISVTVFPEVGAAGMTALRLVFSAAILLVIARPRLRGRTRRDWLTVVLFAGALAAMNLSFYEAISRIPLGIAVTIEVLGPLVLSVIMGRRWLNLLWALLALVGVVILGGLNLERLDPIGVAFAVAAGALWAAYILTSAATGRRFERLDGLAIAMAIAAIAVLPFGAAVAGPALVDPRWLVLGLAVAVLSSTIPYAFELVALRRLPESAFGVLMSLSPAIAALAGLVLLGQSVTALDWIAIAIVVVASAGAVLTARRREPIPPTP
jgi:inner membrane transporter RhtA